MARSMYLSRGGNTEGPRAVLVRLGSALMSEALTGLLASRGWQCSGEERGVDPGAVIVDAATIGENLRLKYPRSRVLFLQMEEDSMREAALLSWHGAHGVIPNNCGISGLGRLLSGPVHRARGQEPPLPFTPQEKRVARHICEGATTIEIARALGVTTHTVKVHVHGILSKTRAPNRRSLITLLGACAEREAHEH